ncbi:DNA/RNA polymerase [Schizophyllum commune H4-8]|uniref:DNA/RNA polymerase n=1 Tax=Schizophyllum commune (strain H4-8 / FGSC 9210) TaxID=578458 RepID=UPI00215E3D41|nr:DNA/RNA polymerase [Schizophyllum commune H4-8]KAI5892593.1 DNA/RNA polymerase [Schizophyllum commune H4-8]
MAAYPISWKGKGKATNNDFDLDPTVTYRQLHSSNLGVRDPLRVVALCDSDAFYAACEMVRLGVDKEQPLVVLQWNALIAVNYPARKYGISRMDKLQDALKRCPHLKVVHVATYKEGEKEPGYWDDVDTKTHKVSLDFYRRESTKMQSLFKELLPDVEIEKASIDEAFFDFTKLAKAKLLERFPYLASVPHDAPRGADSPLPPPPPLSWEGLGTVIPVHPPPDKEKERGKQGEDEHKDEDEVDAPESEDDAPNLEDDPTTWHDHALAIAAEYMLKAKEEIYARLGYTTSAGIGRNKFLAKLTASYRKPRGLNVLRNAAIPNYLRPLPFQKAGTSFSIRFLGGKLGKAIAQEYDASTVGDLFVDAPVTEEMQQKFGEESIWVYEVLRGIDRNEVKEKTALFKSMLASKNLPKPITNAADGHQWLRVLAAELALRLKDARLESPNLWPKTLVLHARKGYDTGRSKQAPFPFTNEATVDYIARLADKLWSELVGSATTALNVSSVQLAFTGIGNSEAGQQSISGFFANAKPASSTPAKPGSRVDVDDTLDSGGGTRDSDAAFRCARCRKDIALPYRPDDAGDRASALAALRLEHDDFHFAQDLARSERVTPTPAPVRPTKKRKKGGKAEGIEKFFARK